MKYFTILFLSMAVLWTTNANSQSKKYTFVEHFSNTKCPICNSNRSTIESNLNKYSGEVNTMTIHRKYPYSTCPLYLYAQEEVDNREAVYSNSTSPLSGTPTLCVNSVPGSHSRLTNNIDQALEDDEVLVGLNMKESGTTNKKAELEVFNLTDAEMKDLYVYAALIEREVNIDGTKIHHVFRKFLGSEKGKGDAVGALGAGASKTITLEGQVPNDLEPSDLYILAWVEQRVPDGNKYDLIMHNSVSQTTQVITGNELAIPESELSLYPNPANQQLHIRNTSDFKPDHYRILTIAGREIRTVNGSSATIGIADLPAGQYILMLENEHNRVSRKFLKQ